MTEQQEKDLLDDSQDDIRVQLREITVNTPTKEDLEQGTKVSKNIKQTIDKSKFHCLLSELILEDSAAFTNYHRVTRNQFDDVITYVGPIVKRSDTQLRKATSPEERLSVTLRFLATGKYIFILHMDLMIKLCKLLLVLEVISNGLLSHSLELDPSSSHT